jgi:hypothetical protein
MMWGDDNHRRPLDRQGDHRKACTKYATVARSLRQGAGVTFRLGCGGGRPRSTSDHNRQTFVPRTHAKRLFWAPGRMVMCEEKGAKQTAWVLMR